MTSTPPDPGAELRARMRPSPLQNPGLDARPFGDESGQPVRFYLFKDVVEELTFTPEFDGKTICIALLLGGFGVEDDIGFVEVSGFTGREWVETEGDIYTAVREQLDTWIRDGAGEPVVGLYVSDPTSGGRVTEEMARVHFSLFNIPFQALVAFDPGTGSLSVSARAPRSRFFNAAFRAIGTREGLKPDATSGNTEHSESRGDSEE